MSGLCLRAVAGGYAARNPVVSDVKVFTPPLARSSESSDPTAPEKSTLLKTIAGLAQRLGGYLSRWCASRTSSSKRSRGARDYVHGAAGLCVSTLVRRRQSRALGLADPPRSRGCYGRHGAGLRHFRGVVGKTARDGWDAQWRSAAATRVRARSCAHRASSSPLMNQGLGFIPRFQHACTT